MANNVFVNGREIACKKSDGKSVCAFPDVCMTPPETPATPPGVPVPYPNTGYAKDTTNGSKTVKISGKEVMLKNKSYFKQSTGDEAGSAAKKGVVTGVNRGKVYFDSWSMNVKIEGKNVVRHLDLTTHNHASAPGNSPPVHFTARSYSEDDALVDCILELCDTDPEIVKRAADKLTLYSVNPFTVETQTYDGAKWKTTEKATVRGYAQGDTIGINRRQDCSRTKGTLYHEVHHTKQDPKMSSRDREIDAYMQTEQWLIESEIPGTKDFRSTTADGRTIPNRKAIEQHVDKKYGYSSTTPRIIKTENGGKTVVFRDGKKRPARLGDRTQYIPPGQKLDKRRIPPEKLQCP